MKNKHVWGILLLSIVLSIGLAAFFIQSIASAATTITGSTISTNGIQVDASTTPLPFKRDALRLDVTAGADQVTGQNIQFDEQQSYPEGIAQLISIHPPTSGLQGADTLIGSYIDLESGTNDYSVIEYNSHVGLLIGNRSGPLLGTTSSAGIEELFNSEMGTYDIQSSGVFSGLTQSLVKSAGTGTLSGIGMSLKNSSTDTSSVRGLKMEIDLGSTSPATTAGITINRRGTGTGILKDGIIIGTNNVDQVTSIEDGIDLSDSHITNAINLGTNKILASGSFNIDLAAVTADTLTITNSDVTAKASLAIEDGLTIGNNGSNPGTKILKHLSTTASIDVAQLSSTTCSVFTINLNGAAIGDSVVATPGADGAIPFSAESSVWSAYALTDQVKVRVCNPGNGWGTNPSAVTWRVDVWQH